MTAPPNSMEIQFPVPEWASLSAVEPVSEPPMYIPMYIMACADYGWLSSTRRAEPPPIAASLAQGRAVDARALRTAMERCPLCRALKLPPHAPGSRPKSRPIGCAMRTPATASIAARPSTLSSRLGHASVATTGRYLHARPTDSSARYLGV